MIIGYEIIKRNIEIVNEAIENSVEVRNFNEEVEQEINKIKHMLSSITDRNRFHLEASLSNLEKKMKLKINPDLSEIQNFILFKFKSELRGMPLIQDELDIQSVLDNLYARAKQPDFLEFLKTMTKRRFNNLLKRDEKLDKLNGLYNKYRSRKQYKENFTQSEPIIMNWVIQNKVDFGFKSIGYFYFNEISPFTLGLDYSYQNTKKFLDGLVDLLQRTDIDILNMSHKILFKQVNAIILEQISQRAKEKGSVKFIENTDAYLTNQKSYEVLDAVLKERTCSCGTPSDLSVNYQINCDDNKQRLLPSSKFRDLGQVRRETLEKFFSE